jgi:hypothetical protein
LVVTKAVRSRKGSARAPKLAGRQGKSVYFALLLASLLPQWFAEQNRRF